MHDQDKISVFLVGPNNVDREGIRRILDAENFQVSMSDQSSFIVLDRAKHSENIDLIIFDSGSFEENDPDDWEMLHREHPEARTVVLADDFDYDKVVAAFQRGVDGYILKKVHYEVLVTSLRLVSLGEKVVPNPLVDALSEHGNLRPQERLAASTLSKLLTEREMETFRNMCQGHPNKVIARHMGTSESTVKVHVKAILRKLHLQNRTQVVAWAFESGFEPEAPLVDSDLVAAGLLGHTVSAANGEAMA